MKIYLIETPEFMVDGGAFFGIIPKAMWSKKYPSDENNLCRAACRSLLIDDGNKIILCDTGIGRSDNQEKTNNYIVDYSSDLIYGLEKIGYKPEMITDVVLSHLHFDHCGGTSYFDNISNTYKAVFSNATHHISNSQWKNALNPNYREKSSYNKKNFEFLKNSTKLNLIQDTYKISEFVEIFVFDGHTPGLILPYVKTHTRNLFFAGDLIPAMASIPLAWVSAYDLIPLKSIEEKIFILEKLLNDNGVIVFQHDFYNECCDLIRTDKGIRANNTYKFDSIFLANN